MALAERPRKAPAKGGAKRSESSVASASGKARQRARNKEAGNVSPSGSSGTAKRVANLPKKSWEEVQGELEHLTDIVGKISHSQVGASGYLVATLNCPKEYAHDLLDAHLHGDGLVFIRIYYAPVDAYMGKDNDGDED